MSSLRRICAPEGTRTCLARGVNDIKPDLGTTVRRCLLRMTTSAISAPASAPALVPIWGQHLSQHRRYERKHPCLHISSTRSTAPHHVPTTHKAPKTLPSDEITSLRAARLLHSPILLACSCQPPGHRRGISGLCSSGYYYWCHQREHRAAVVAWGESGC